jgi:hypothetical protein
LAVGASGELYVSDTQNNRVIAVHFGEKVETSLVANLPKVQSVYRGIGSVG